MTARAPINVEAPTIAGSDVYGQVLAASAGGWEGAQPIEFSYQWQSCNATGGECANVAGATESTYQLGSGDVGNTVRVLVTASNGGGSGQRASAATGTIEGGFGVGSEFGSEGVEAGQLVSPGGVALDGRGHVWVLDYGNERLQEFSESGHYVRQLGSFGGEPGQFDRPSAIALDTSGDLWVADTANSRVEEFNAEGVFVRAIGSPGSEPGQLEEPEGVAIDGHGDVWVSDTGNGRVEEFSPEGHLLRVVGSLGLAPGQLLEPAGLAVEGNGTVVVADFAADRIVEYSESGEYLREFGSAGSGPGEIGNPYGVAVDSSEHVWVGDVSDDRIEEFTQAGSFVQEFGSEGSQPGQLLLSYPMGLAVGASGVVWIADPGNDRVEAWETGHAAVNQFPPSLTGTAQDGQTLDVVDGGWVGGQPISYSYQWQRCNSAGEACVNIAGATGASYRAGDADVGSTLRALVTARNAGGLTVVASPASAVVKPSAPYEKAPPSLAGAAEEGTMFTATNGEWEGMPVSFTYQWELCNAGGEGCANVSGATGSAFEVVSSDLGHTLRVVVTAANSSGTAASTSAASAVVTVDEMFAEDLSVGCHGVAFSEPVDVTVDSKGDRWILDGRADRVTELNPSGECIKEFGSEGSVDGQLKEPAALALNSHGDVLIADTGNRRVDEFNPNGEFIRAIGSEGEGSVGFTEGVAVDAHNDVWVSGTYQSRVFEFSEEGTFKRQIGSAGSEPGQFTTPAGIAVGPQGSVWVVDRGSARVEQFSEEGAYLSQFGSGGSKWGQLSSPSGIAADGHGSLWVVDRGNERVEQFSEAGSFRSVFGSSGAGAGQFNFGVDAGIAVEGSGELLVADGDNHRVQEFVSPVAPASATTPAIAGSARVGQTLAASTGTWTGTVPLTFSYQWQRCSATGEECANIAGATQASYVVGEGLVEATIRVLVSASNVKGAASAVSSTSADVPPPAPPSSTSPPLISGEAADGQTMSASAGGWSTVGDTSYAYQWERCSPSGGECAAIEGASEAQYTLSGLISGVR